MDYQVASRSRERLRVASCALTRNSSPARELEQCGRQTQTAPAQTQQQAQTTAQDNSFPDDIDYFPIPITEDVVKRGRRSLRHFL